MQEARRRLGAARCATAARKALCVLLLRALQCRTLLRQAIAAILRIGLAILCNACMHAQVPGT